MARRRVALMVDETVELMVVSLVDMKVALMVASSAMMRAVTMVVWRDTWKASLTVVTSAALMAFFWVDE